MKTKKFFAVEVFDNTCNVLGHESGIYGKGDYSWVTDSLNGGCDADYNMTEEEANEVKADFERIIKERNLDWASVGIDSVEIPVAETMQDVADYYNESDTLGPELDAMIEANGWISDCDSECGISLHSLRKKKKISTNLTMDMKMMESNDKKQHGGRRSGAGRPANDRSIMVGVRITKEAADILNAQPNKSEFIDNLIKKSV